MMDFYIFSAYRHLLIQTSTDPKLILKRSWLTCGSASLISVKYSLILGHALQYILVIIIYFCVLYFSLGCSAEGFESIHLWNTQMHKKQQIPSARFITKLGHPGLMCCKSIFTMPECVATTNRAAVLLVTVCLFVWSLFKLNEMAQKNVAFLNEGELHESENSAFSTSNFV